MYWTRYLPGYISTLLYMLQMTEYQPGRYLAWLHRTSDYRSVMRRGSLDRTAKVRALRFVLRLVYLLLMLVIVVLIIAAAQLGAWWPLTLAALALVVLPLLLAYGVLVPLIIGRVLVQAPRERKLIAAAEHIIANHPATRIAIVGSYGKTTAKELLKTVLSEGLEVAATPGNMNTPIGISRFAATLTGSEQVAIFEYGEGRPGDVQDLARLTHPELAIVTGINEAHLESFGSLDATVATIAEITDYVETEALYVNHENQLARQSKDLKGHGYSSKGVGSWKVTNAQTSVEGTTFTLSKGKTRIKAQTGLVGLHTIGVTAAAIAIASELGLTTKQIGAGLRKVVPFEHRMAPRPLHGAWVIDDTYNGNSDGVAAGLAFLKDSGAKRRVYVTPGLVEQGDQTEAVHVEMGKQAAASADVIVLMRNSATSFIQQGIEKKGFKGTLLIVDDPLDFYTNLDSFVAAGDIVLMQNDWTDNYN